MNLRPELRAVMSTLGVTEPELETLKARMMFSVMNLEAQVDALWTPQCLSREFLNRMNHL